MGGRAGFGSPSLGVPLAAAELAVPELAVPKGPDSGKNSFDNRRGRRSGGEELGRFGCDAGLGGGTRADRAESGVPGAATACSGSTVGRMAE